MSTSCAEFIVTLTPWGKRRWHLVRVIVIDEVRNGNTLHGHAARSAPVFDLP
jgi:hypothetical protein